MSIERTIPHLDTAIVYVLTGHDKKFQSEENYLKKIAEFERSCEKSLIETFNSVDIRGMVKTDPYSLPYTEEILVTLNGESYMNGPYEFYRVARRIVKELLAKDVYRLRFYMYINVVTPDATPESSLGEKIRASFGKIEYRFRYTVRTT